MKRAKLENTQSFWLRSLTGRVFTASRLESFRLGSSDAFEGCEYDWMNAQARLSLG